MSTRIPAEAFPPGDWIREGLEDRGWTQSDLAEILGRPIQLVNELIAGKKSITPETAKGLAEAFDMSPQFWLNLDAAYQLYISRDADPSVALRRPNCRRKRGNDAWHFCTNCSNWPTTDYESTTTKPTSDEFCNECLAKERAGTCS